jgi:UPF0755 protein
MSPFRVLRFLALVALLAAAAAGAAAYWLLQRPLPLPASPWDFEVRPGASLGSIARQLADAGIVPHPQALTLYARARGQDRAIKAGSYEIEQGITLPGLLAKLTQGDVTQTSLTVVEGITFAEFRQALRDHPQVAKTIVDLPDAELLARIGATGASAEGRFFPDTYFFAANSTDAALLKRAQRTLEQRLAAAWERRSPDLPVATPYELLILASIVEKETGRAADRPLIASVFANRLRKNMRLQTDPTVIYGLGAKFDGNLRRRDLDTDTPYNTYTRDGLPPTPIALPSQASLDAAAHPPPSPYLYFVARGDGTSEFSASLAEHNRAVSKYQRGGK